MKRIIIILLLFLVGTLGTAGKSQAYSNVSFSFSFHDALQPYGSWVNVSAYGNVFRPHAYAGWRPYSSGHWIYTDYGPMWDTSEPYGWATYHYGRWIFTASYGWVWVPGYDYYPSQVTWAYGDNYLGWSPIYPNPGYSNANLWFFIDRNHYGYDNYSRYYLGRDRIRPLFDRRVVRVRDSRWNRGDFERVINRPVRVVRVRERSFEADQRRVRMLVPENRESQVIREVTRASKVKLAKGNRFEDSRSKVVVKNQPKGLVKVESHKSSKAYVKSSAPKKTYTAPKKSYSSHKSSTPKKTSASHSKFSNNNDRVEVKHSSKSKALVKSTAPKKSYTSSAKFTSKKADVKPKTSFTSNKKFESKATSKTKVVSKHQTEKKAVKKPSRKSKRKPS